jgi:hypothetical protein
VLAASNDFLIEPSIGLFVVALTVLALPAGLVTAAKGRWGWVVVGLLTSGLAWIATAFLLATPDSLWGRAFYGPEKMARARARFPRRLPYPQA